jgi:hypothetical protein
MPKHPVFTTHTQDISLCLLNYITPFCGIPRQYFRLLQNSAMLYRNCIDTAQQNFLPVPENKREVKGG